MPVQPHRTDPTSGRRGGPRPPRSHLAAAFGALLLVAPAPSAAPGPVGPASSPPASSRPAAPAAGEEDAGRLALAAAASARKQAYALEGEERRAALVAAAQAFGAVADDEAFGAAERAEGAFRAGEILRAQDLPGEARARFSLAVALGQASADGEEFAARALLEQAHMARRDDDAEGALALYEQVRRDWPGQRRSSAHAATWIGKLLLHDEGWTPATDRGIARLAAFMEEFPEYPTEAVRNADMAAVRCLEAGEPDRAREILTRLRARMQPVVAAGGRQGEAVAKALERMRAVELLPSGSGSAGGETAASG